MKKVELHVHLDGSVRESTLRELLINEGMEVPTSFHVTNDVSSLNEYLEKFDYPIKVMQTSENLKRIAFELTEDLKKDEVIYAEIRFAPLKHTLKGLNLDEVVLSVMDGLKTSDLKTTLILCCMRNDNLEDNKKVVDIASKYNLPVDLAGAEAMYETSSFENLFDYIRSLNLKYTIHAGEASGKDSIKAAISFKTKRIGHGIKCDDEIIYDYLKNDITLEICPTSNIQTKATLSIKDNPIYKLYNSGVKVTINTDNRTISNTTLEKEYELLKENFPFKEEDFMIMNEYAIDASFTDKKQELKNMLYS